VPPNDLFKTPEHCLNSHVSKTGQDTLLPTYQLLVVSGDKTRFDELGDLARLELTFTTPQKFSSTQLPTNKQNFDVVIIDNSANTIESDSESFKLDLPIIFIGDEVEIEKLQQNKTAKVTHYLVATELNILKLVQCIFEAIGYAGQANAIQKNEQNLNRLVEALEEKQSFLTEVLDHIPNPVFVKDKDLRYITYNKAFRDHYVKEGDWQGKTLVEIDQDVVKNQSFMHDTQLKLLRTDAAYRKELVVTNKQNEKLNILASASTFTYGKAKQQGLIGISQDITQLKATEGKLAESLENQKILNEKLGLLNELSLQLSNTTHIDQVLETVCQHTKKIIDTDRVSVALVSNTGVPEAENTFKIYLLDQNHNGYKDNGSYTPNKIGVLSELIHSPKLLVVDEINPDSLLAKDGFKCFMSSPVVIADEVIATLNVASKSRDCFNSKEQLWLEHITTLISNALQKQKLLEQSQSALSQARIQSERLAELNKLSKMLITAESHDSICKITLNEVSKLIESELTTFTFATEDGQQLATFRNTEDGTEFLPTGRLWPVENTSIGKAVTKKEIIYSNFEESDLLDCRQLVHFELKSGLAVPLIIENKVLGTINVTSKRSSAYTEDDKAFMLQLASLVATSLENKRLFEESQKTLGKLKNSEQELRVLFENETRKSNELILLDRVQSVIADKLALEQIFETAVKTIAELLHYRAIAFCEIIGDRIYHKQSQAHGYLGTVEDGYNTTTLDTGIICLAARSKQPMLIKDVRTNSNYNAVFEDVVSNIAIPVFRNKTIMGVIIVEHTERLDETDLNLLSKIAEQLSIATENATLHEQVLSDLKYTEALYKINQLVHSTSHLQDHLPEIIAITQETVSADWIMTEIYDSPNDVLLPEYICKDKQIESLIRSPHQVPILRNYEKGVTSFQAIDLKKAVVTSKTISEQYLSDYNPALQHSLGMTSTVAIPFYNDLKNAEVSGVASAFRLSEHGEFSEADITFLNSVVRQVSVALTQQSLNKRIEFQAFHDDLTELPNRRKFEKELTERIKKAHNNNSQVGLIYLDLDGFKHINDTFGHDIGDLLLQLTSSRLKAITRNDDLLARMGGDEFAVILSDTLSCQNAMAIAQRYLNCLEEPFILKNNPIKITTSIGISIFPEDGLETSSLLKHADVAMYLAKDHGKNGIKVFSQHLADKARARLTLENNLRLAIDNEEFILHYQPQYCLTTGKLIGTEALIRWQHKDDGLIPPYQFIPIAEETLLIIAIGEWALLQACKQTALWHKQGHEITVSVNVAAPQFMHTNFIETVTNALKTSGLDAQYLELEVTEGVVMGNVEVVAAKLQKLRDLGVTIALDDFGTGFSSLQYLQNLPFDKLKIDRSFIMNIGEVENDSRDKVLIRNIMQLATGFDLKVIAEGIETLHQAIYLKDLGCQFAQGFYYARPTAANEIFALSEDVAEPVVEQAASTSQSMLN